MENIHEPNSNFVFDDIVFATPAPVAGGNHFIRNFSNKQQKPLYLQPPKCKLKSGVVKVGKRMYCDLIFTQYDEEFIEWVDKYETLCQNRIYENRSKWFESTLEKHDIENSFSPTIKLYKAGKQYTMRVHIPTRLGKSALKVYNEQEEDVPLEMLKENSSVITILEFQGIKCSSRNFQLEIEAKQMMLLNDVDIFEKCAFKKKNTSIPAAPIVTKQDQVIVETVEDETKLDPKAQKSETEDVLENNDSEKIEINLENFQVESTLASKTSENATENENPSNEVMEEVKDEMLDLDEVKTDKEDEDGMYEIDLPYDDLKEEVRIKEQNEVYYNMYREARKKAIIARDMALAHYLEAKRIKDLYALDDSELNDNENIETMEKDLEFDIVAPSAEVK